MSIKVNDNIRALGPKPLDSKYFNATNTPYANSAEVLAAININERHEGLKVRIGSADYEFGADKITLTVTGGGGGGGGTWGSITGDLADQTDLQDALNNKVDNVTGERLITAAEITKLGNTSGANTGDQDLSPYELLSSKQTDLTSSATKYPTVNAVVTGLALKVDKVVGKSLLADTEVTRLLAITGTNTGDQDLSVFFSKTEADDRFLKLVGGLMSGSINFGETTNPPIEIENNGGAGSGVKTILTSAASYSTTDWVNDLNEIVQLLVTGSTFNNGLFKSKAAYFNSEAQGGAGVVASHVDGKIILATGGQGNDNVRMVVHPDGKITIGWGLNEPQAYDFAVNGDVYFNGTIVATGYNNVNWNTAFSHSQDVTTNPHGVTKTQVGLSNVDNTSDAGKPVSTAQQTALDLKQATLTNPITGTGSTNKIPKFTGSSALGNSLVTDDGTTVTVEGLLAVSKSVAASYNTINFENLASNGYVQNQFKVSANIANLQYAPTLFYRLTTNEASTPIILAPNGTTALTVLPSGASTFASTLQATRLGLGAAANLASYLNVIANTASVGQLYLPPSAVDYTGTLSGMLWNNTSEWKFYDGVLSSVNRLLKLNGNTALANANALNVVTSTGTGGNLGTLKAEVSFSRFPTAVSYTILLTDVGFGWIIAVTSTAAARTITLPLANTVTAGFQLTVKDESGAAGTNNISIALSGADATDVTNITTNGGSRTVYSDGVSKWFSI